MPTDLDDITITLTTPNPIALGFPPPAKYSAGGVTLPPLGIEMIEPGPQGPPGAAGGLGPQGPPGAAGGLDFNQSTPLATWLIPHNLGRYPSVTVRDSAGEVVVGMVTYIDTNNLQVDFSAAFGGSAYLI